MKNKIIIIISGLILIVLISALIFFCLKENKKHQEQLRYIEILDKFEEAIKWELDATNYSEKRCEPNVTKAGIRTSSYLISQGYLKKDDMKDFGNDLYCKAYANYTDTKECDVDYKIYLKCDNYETKGYGLGW